MSAFIEVNRGRFGVEPICRALGVSASAYYARLSGERSARAVEDERLLGVIRAVHEESYEAYGYRRMWKELLRRGELVARCQVQRLMADNAIQGAKRRGRPWRTTVADPDAARRPDLVGRDFTATKPGELVVADFTYVRCWQGLVFFAFCLDVFSRMIVGWQLAAHMRAELVVDALKMALGTRTHLGHVELVHHSDRGSQYTSAELAAVMAARGVLASVGSTGDCYDNAMAESLVDTYKTELIADRVWKTATEVELGTVGWVGWYNNVRLHGELGDIPPVEYEQNALAAVAARATEHGAGGSSLSSPYGLAAVDPAAPPDTLL
ncbi:MAG: IS3 family transposase, partial [Pseudonocardiaceae bacterium]